MSWPEILESRLLQAVVAGAFVSLGWIVNGWQNRRKDSRLRAEKLRDYHRAFYAEIGANVENLSSERRIEAYALGMIERMRADETFIPLIPREVNDFTFDSLVADIAILPRQTIDAVVAYYSQVKSIAAMVEDMRGDAFRQIGQDRRIAMYRDYIEMKKQALLFGRFANAVIAAYAESGRDGADREIERFNTRAAVLSDRSQE